MAERRTIFAPADFLQLKLKILSKEHAWPSATRHGTRYLTAIVATAVIVKRTCCCLFQDIAQPKWITYFRLNIPIEMEVSIWFYRADLATSRSAGLMHKGWPHLIAARISWNYRNIGLGTCENTKSIWSDASGATTEQRADYSFNRGDPIHGLAAPTSFAKLIGP